MFKSIEATGKTIDLAIQAGLEQLQMDRDSVSVEVLAQPRSGFFGIGASPAKVSLTYEVPDPTPEPVPQAPEKPQQTPPRKVHNTPLFMGRCVLFKVASMHYTSALSVSLSSSPGFFFRLKSIDQ